MKDIFKVKVELATLERNKSMYTFIKDLKEAKKYILAKNGETIGRVNLLLI